MSIQNDLIKKSGKLEAKVEFSIETTQTNKHYLHVVMQGKWSIDNFRKAWKVAKKEGIIFNDYPVIVDYSAQSDTPSNIFLLAGQFSRIFTRKIIAVGTQPIASKVIGILETLFNKRIVRVSSFEKAIELLEKEDDLKANIDTIIN